MFSGNFIEAQHSWLLTRRASKSEILKNGGQQALIHSPKDIVRIDFALKRLREGQYGICTHCGGLIEEKRLRIIPETPFCTSCSNAIEAQ